MSFEIRSRLSRRRKWQRLPSEWVQRIYQCSVMLGESMRRSNLHCSKNKSYVSVQRTEDTNWYDNNSTRRTHASFCSSSSTETESPRLGIPHARLGGAGLGWWSGSDADTSYNLRFVPRLLAASEGGRHHHRPSGWHVGPPHVS